MNNKMTLSLAPFLLLLTACSSHYSASNHGYGHTNSHISVGVHGHGKINNVVGGLIIGGLIGHLLTENAHHTNNVVNDSKATSEDELVNGYSVSGSQSKSTQDAKPEVNDEQNKFYKLGKDGNCYLMEYLEKGEASVVSQVPKYSCQ